MLKTENFQTYGWESAIRGMRNPMNSWQKSDSGWEPQFDTEKGPVAGVFVIGPNDLELMKRLRKGGPDDRKYLRQIFVSVDITAPLYWWKEMDQYKVGTVTNSCSTMHKIASKEFTLEDFSYEHLTNQSINCLKNTIRLLNTCRALYISKTDKRVDQFSVMSDDCYTEYKKSIWWQMIQLLPSSYNQKRTWTANYEVLCNIYHARKNHKLDEWHTLCDAIANLPYAKELIIGGDQK